MNYNGTFTVEDKEGGSFTFSTLSQGDYLEILKFSTALNDKKADADIISSITEFVERVTKGFAGQYVDGKEIIYSPGIFSTVPFEMTAQAFRLYAGIKDLTEEEKKESTPLQG